MSSSCARFEVLQDRSGVNSLLFGGVKESAQFAFSHINARSKGGNSTSCRSIHPRRFPATSGRSSREARFPFDLSVPPQRTKRREKESVYTMGVSNDTKTLLAVLGLLVMVAQFHVASAMKNDADELQKKLNNLNISDSDTVQNKSREKKTQQKAIYNKLQSTNTDQYVSSIKSKENTQKNEESEVENKEDMLGFSGVKMEESSRRMNWTELQQIIGIVEEHMKQKHIKPPTAGGEKSIQAMSKIVTEALGKKAKSLLPADLQKISKCIMEGKGTKEVAKQTLDLEDIHMQTSNVMPKIEQKNENDKNVNTQQKNKAEECVTNQQRFKPQEKFIINKGYQNPIHETPIPQKKESAQKQRHHHTQLKEIAHHHWQGIELFCNTPKTRYHISQRPPSQTVSIDLSICVFSQHVIL